MGKASLLTDTVKEGMEYPIKLTDENDNVVYYEDSNGFWFRNVYNDFNRITFHEDSNYYWAKAEYDTVGNQIYHECSDGLIRMTLKLNKKELTIKELEEMLAKKNIKIVKG